MRSLVTSELFRTLPMSDIAMLRFNFRGVEGSEGTYGGGVDERHDVIAAIDRLRAATTAEPLVLAGWSFGADVSASVLDHRLAGWFLIAPPLRVLPADQFVVASDPRPEAPRDPRTRHVPPARQRSGGYEQLGEHDGRDRRRAPIISSSVARARWPTHSSSSFVAWPDA